jgi:protein arginine kinase activator
MDEELPLGDISITGKSDEVEKPSVGHPNLPIALDEFMKFLTNSMKTKAQMPGMKQSEPCPSCGETLETIAKTKQLGCPTCYEHFKNELKSVLKATQGGATQHVGKVPKRWAAEHKKALVRKKEAAEEEEKRKEEEADIHERIRLLKSKQAKAIKIENYEAAGALKVKIEALEKELNDDSESTAPSSEDQ